MICDRAEAEARLRKVAAVAQLEWDDAVVQEALDNWLKDCQAGHMSACTNNPFRYYVSAFMWKYRRQPVTRFLKPGG